MEHVLQVLAQNGLLLAAFAWLLKFLVSDKLKTIGDDIRKLQKSREEDTGKIHAIDGRVIRLETWKESTEHGVLGRRASDRCPLPDCPIESRP